MKIMIVVSIKKPELAELFYRNITRIIQNPGVISLFNGCQVVDATSPVPSSDVPELIRNSFSTHPKVPIVLVSDWLLSPSQALPSITASAILREFRQRPLGSIALMRRAARVPDIDRTVAADCSEGELSKALQLVIERLIYVMPPPERRDTASGTVTVRPLRDSNETEYRKYLGQRHRIYRVMGYLDEDVENCLSQLEINAVDTHALHVGAFFRQGSTEILVGTARVVTNTPPDESLRQMLSKIAARDIVLRQRLATPYNLTLPIFQSHRGMNAIMRESLKKNYVCGELSRVTVLRDYRGSGISRLLIAKAVSDALAQGVQRLFLECLEIHCPIYEKQGFKRIAGIEGPVVDVGRTMVAMEFDSKSLLGMHIPTDYEV